MFQQLSYPNGMGVIIQDDGVAVWRGDGYVFINREVWDELTALVASCDGAVPKSISPTSQPSDEVGETFNVTFHITGTESYLVNALNEEDAFNRAALRRVYGEKPDDTSSWVSETEVLLQYQDDPEAEMLLDEC